jgi:hypothetical protein
MFSNCIKNGLIRGLESDRFISIQKNNEMSEMEMEKRTYL